VRTKENVLIQRRYSHPVDKSTGVRSDQTVVLATAGSFKAYQEAVRQHAIAALNLTQQAKLHTAGAGGDTEGEAKANTALIDGVRRYAMDVRELDIDLIDRINPFEAAYAVLAKAMDERTLRQVQTTIAAKKISISVEEARELAERALLFKRERGRVPDINSQDAWEKRMAEGVAAFARYRAQQKTDVSNGRG
jgi:hypothetical protein